MKPLDVQNLDETETKDFQDYLMMIKASAFERREFDERRYAIDKALKQEYRDDLSSATRRPINSTNQNYNDSNRDLLAEQEGPNQRDEYSDLYLPHLLQMFRTLLVNIKNLCFPANGDWLNITRTFSDYFYKSGTQDFLPFINEAWVNILKTENQRYNFKEIYCRTLAESIAYGNTVLGHSYNEQLHVMEPYSPGISCSGVFPIADDWRKSNLCTYYDVNYHELLDRVDLNQEIVSMLEPSSDSMTGVALRGAGSTRQKDYYRRRIPFGKVRLHDFFLPSIFIKRSTGENLIARNVYITAVIEPSKQAGAKLDLESIYILKASQDVDPLEHGLLFGAYSVTQPGVFYNQGALQPFLPHQILANQNFSGMARTSQMVASSPTSFTAADGALIDWENTPLDPLEPNATYYGVVATPTFGPEYANVINTCMSVASFLERTIEEGVGVSKGAQGTMHVGRKTATEVIESYSGAQLNLVEPAGQYDGQILRPSISVRLRATQKMLAEQVEKTINETLQKEAALIQQGDQVYEAILSSNKLFRRLLNFSGIQASYEEYYKRQMEKILKNQQIAEEIQHIAQQAIQLYNLADAPIQPFVPPSPEQMGMPMLPPDVVQKMAMGWEQQQQQEKDGQRQQAKQLELEAKLKQLTFKDIVEPPEPSLKLMYEMLTAPIEDSDVIVMGSMTTISKELARENLLMLLQSIGNFPQKVLMKLDYDSILMMLARSNDVALRDLIKDEADILKDTEAADQQAEIQQQLVMNAARGKAGAQPPQIGKGSTT